MFRYSKRISGLFRFSDSKEEISARWQGVHKYLGDRGLSFNEILFSPFEHVRYAGLQGDQSFNQMEDDIGQPPSLFFNNLQSFGWHVYADSYQIGSACLVYSREDTAMLSVNVRPSGYVELTKLPTSHPDRITKSLNQKADASRMVVTVASDDSGLVGVVSEIYQGKIQRGVQGALSLVSPKKGQGHLS